MTVHFDAPKANQQLSGTRCPQRRRFYSTHPALHSLKRDQLVKLCKIHSLKANGKNKELIERLQLHAKHLPPDDPLSIAVRSDNLDAKRIVDSGDEGPDAMNDDYGEGSSTRSYTVPRPSEQWEMVMDSIAEVDEDTKSTLRSYRGNPNAQAGEFGTHTSKAASSVSSSLKAIATSLGLKRSTTKSGVASTALPSLSTQDEVAQSPSTLRTSEVSSAIQDPPVDPIPGTTNLQGVPAPASARLSISQAPTTTTVRLVSSATARPELLLSPPKLLPFTTTFDLAPGTPGGTVNEDAAPIPVWPLSPCGATNQSIYPSIPAFQGFGDLHSQSSAKLETDNASDMEMDVDMPGGLDTPPVEELPAKIADANIRLNTGATPKSAEKPSSQPLDIFSPAPKPQRALARERLALPRSEPFIFGSPLPQHNLTNVQFRSTAQSVLDEMNRRLAEEGVDPVNIGVIENHRKSTQEATDEKLGEKVDLRIADKFDKLHQEEFDKMKSITSHYAAKRGSQGNAPEPIVSKKRKSSLVVKEKKSGVPAPRHRPSGSRVASGASSTKKPIPGGFGDEDDDDGADRRTSKRPRVDMTEKSDTEASTQDKRVSTAPIASETDQKEEMRKQKEREVIRRRLEHNKAKRRSSMGRPSLVGRGVPREFFLWKKNCFSAEFYAVEKNKTSRFGFLSSAKSLVQNVWNRNAGSKTVPSNLPVAKSVSSKEGSGTLSKVASLAKKTAVIPGSSGAPPASSHPGGDSKRIPSGSNTSGRSTMQLYSERSTFGPTENGGTASFSRSSRAPLPSFHAPSTATTTISRLSATDSHGNGHSRSGSMADVSSLCTKQGISSTSRGVSSMGARTSIRASTASLHTRPASSIVRSRKSSTLLAPTASSLAKTITHSRIPLPGPSQSENANVNKAAGSSKYQKDAIPTRRVESGSALERITNSPRGSAPSPGPKKFFTQPLVSPSPVTFAAATVGVSDPARTEVSSKPLVPPKPKVLPGRRPRISRSKVIAKLVSQRAAEATAGNAKDTGKTRSSMGAALAGRTRQSHGGRGGDVLMSAKKRARQSEYARRRSRANAAERCGMELD
ncbi:hypothetical protein F5I97DRAFT_1930644 [Phlebopus sp. FC_14]|nr:hypothetical protein F5I97DRAFT_1930644 [Phlebopus sp. FC_14]